MRQMAGRHGRVAAYFCPRASKRRMSEAAEGQQQHGHVALAAAGRYGAVAAALRTPVRQSARPARPGAASPARSQASFR